LRERDHSENLVLNGRILLKCVLKDRLGCRGIHCSASGQGEMAACCERNNKYSGAIKCMVAGVGVVVVGCWSGVGLGVGVRGLLEYLKELRFLESTLLYGVSSRVVT
jgi:hypothetical protein